MIQLNIIGRIGQDAIVKQVNGKTVTNFSVATNLKTVNTETGEVTKKTVWVNCALWRNEVGKLSEYLKKGQEVFVQGTADFKIYKKDDKTPGLDIRLRVERVELIGDRRELENSASTNPDTDWNFPEEQSNNQDGSEKDDKFWSDPHEQDKAAAKILEGVENPFKG